MSDKPATKKLNDAQIMRLIDERQKLLVAKSEATLAIRTKMVELQAELADLSRPFDNKITRFEQLVTAAILERGTVEGLNTGDVDVVYVSGYTRRSVDLDGIWNLQTSAPKLWNAIVKFCRMTPVAPRVQFK